MAMVIVVKQDPFPFKVETITDKPSVQLTMPSCVGYILTPKAITR